MVFQSRSVKHNIPVVKAPSITVLALVSLLSPAVLSFSETPSLAQISAPTISAPAAFGDAYVLGAGDQIKIDMYGQDNLFSTPYDVLSDGTISLPFIGRIKVGGNTISQSQVAIAQRYTQFFKRPYVTVVLTKARDIKLNIAGEVVRPGPYPIPQTEQNPTVASLIKLAGGSTPVADLQKVQVRRPRKDGSSQVIISDVQRLIRDGDGSQNLLLRDGDTVMVLAATPEEIAAANLGNHNLLPEEPDPLNVAVVGEVYRPGPYVITSTNSVIQEAGQVGTQGRVRGSGQPTVSQAIQQAGGIKPEADIRKIQVRRQTRFGDEQVLEVDLWKLLQDGDMKQDIALQSRDTIIIPTSTASTSEEKITQSTSTLAPETIDVNIVGEVRQPGNVKIRPNTPLSSAVLAAGGFDSRRANKKSVDLIRVEPDGTVTQRRIALNFNGEIDEKTNPALKNNDVVVIRRSGLATFGDNFGNAFAPFSGVSTILRLLPGI